MDQIGVLLIIEETDWADRLSCFLKSNKDIKIMGLLCHHKEGIALAREMDVDVVVIDLFLGYHFDGIYAAREICRSCRSKVLMLANTDQNDMIYDAFHAGAVDYMLKDHVKKLPDAIRAAYRGESPISSCVADQVRAGLSRLRNLEAELLKSKLTPAEIKILQRTAKGLKRKEIAGMLYLEESTVKNHIQHILRKTGEKRIKSAAQKLKRLGVI